MAVQPRRTAFQNSSVNRPYGDFGFRLRVALHDRETLEIFEMVYCGKMNKSIVEKLQRNGVNAVGLSGMDGRIWEGVRKAAITILEAGKRKVLRDDFTGKVEKVNLELIHSVTNGGFDCLDAASDQL
jgi:acetylglutamate kinase